jgi:inhibitor of KinA
MAPAIEPLGDAAVIVAWRSLDDSSAWQAVQNATEQLLRHRIDGVLTVAPAFKSLTAYYDCGKLTWKDIECWIAESLRIVSIASLPPNRTVEIPVCYDAEFAMDLASVAESHSLSIDEVVRLHSDAKYVVQMIGFSPGFPYLAGLPLPLQTPRRASPRLKVPVGSVAIGGNQTGIYSLETPGGWNIIGRTPMRLFDPQRDPLCLLRTGDAIRFVAIDRDQYDEFSSKNARLA